MPTCVVSGWMWGDRMFVWNGKIDFEDKKNGLELELVFNPDERNAFMKLFSDQKTPVDTVRGNIMQVSKGLEGKEHKQSVCSVTGSWMEGITFDKDTLWSKGTLQPLAPRPVSDSVALPSDSRHRQDLQLLKLGKGDEAQQAKEQLEDAQRREKKLRLAQKKSLKRSA